MVKHKSLAELFPKLLEMINRSTLSELFKVMYGVNIQWSILLFCLLLVQFCPSSLASCWILFCGPVHN